MAAILSLPQCVKRASNEGRVSRSWHHHDAWHTSKPVKTNLCEICQCNSLQCIIITFIFLADSTGGNARNGQPHDAASSSAVPAASPQHDVPEHESTGGRPRHDPHAWESQSRTHGKRTSGDNDISAKLQSLIFFTRDLTGFCSDVIACSVLCLCYSCTYVLLVYKPVKVSVLLTYQGSGMHLCKLALKWTCDQVSHEKKNSSC